MDIERLNRIKRIYSVIFIIILPVSVMVCLFIPFFIELKLQTEANDIVLFVLARITLLLGILIPTATIALIINSYILQEIRRDLQGIAPITEIRYQPYPHKLRLTIDGVYLHYAPGFFSSSIFTFTIPHYDTKGKDVWMEYLNGILITRIEDRAERKRVETMIKTIITRMKSLKIDIRSMLVAYKSLVIEVEFLEYDSKEIILFVEDLRKLRASIRG